MRFIDNLKFANKQLLLGLVFAGISFLVVLANYCLTKQIAIGGPYYQSIEQSSDLVADILPPPAFIIQLYLSTHELADLEDPTQRRLVFERADRLVSEYKARSSYWMKTLEPGELRTSLDKSSKPAMKFIEVFDKQFSPLVREGNLDEARAIVNDQLAGLFKEHFQLIEETVPIASAVRGKYINEAQSRAVNWSFYSLMVSTSLVALTAIVSWLFGRAISQRVVRLQSAAAAMAAGDLSFEIQADTSDEIGHTFDSYVGMKKSLTMLTNDLHESVLAAQRGDLAARISEENYQGVYRELVVGFNDTLSAVNAPINEAVEVLSNVANRDLRSRMNGTYHGQFDSIKTSLNNALDCLCASLAQVADGAELVNSASCQIANGSQSLAEGASHQASTLASISTSIEQIATNTKHSADNANLGRTLSQQSQASVERGCQAMVRMAESIARIKESSDATARIVKTIDDIAFQTNLLALNAAVEAARAGDAGKGFAVVAEEVRSLAQRSAEAAKSTSQLIEESVKNSEGGVTITKEMSDLLSQISVGSEKVNAIISEIAAVSREQSAGIENVRGAIINLDKLVQQTASNSEESAASGEELNAQASSLASTVGTFQIVMTSSNQFSSIKSKSTTPSKDKSYNQFVSCV